MSGPDRPDESRSLEPRPAFLGKLREAVRDHVGLAPETIPWDLGQGESASDSERVLPAIRGIEIQGVIGRGGMGTVHRARQIGLDRLVALKLVWLGRGESAGDALSLAKGPRAIASLSHPHIVQIFQIGKQDGWGYGVFEYLDGGDLKGALRHGPWSPERAAALVRVLAETVRFIHRRGFVHRDLKCANVLLSAEGVPKIADFGLVKLLADGEAILRESGAVLGTPHAMAPEQAAGNASATGPPTDIHALGLILYELLTGRSPFLGPNRAETLRRVIEMVPDPPSRLRPGIPQALDAICRRCLQKDPSRRYADAGDLAADLSRYLDRSGPTREELEAALDEAERSLYLNRLTLAERELTWGGPEAARLALVACLPNPGRPDLRDSRWSELWDRCEAAVSEPARNPPPASDPGGPGDSTERRVARTASVPPGAG